MIWYFLPGPGIFGGIKVGCQFIDMLNECGRRTAVVIPEGQAPGWFACRTPVVSEEQARASISDQDWLMITWPPDYQRLRDWPGRLVCHCQGTDARMDVICADASVPMLTCWQQARDYLKDGFGRDSVDVGISVSECFYQQGAPKFDNLVAYMPRRGFQTVRRCMRRAKGADFVAIDRLRETEVARRLGSAGIFIATAEGEQFGLPALEAMAAGCLVLSVLVKGGMEYLNNDENCLVVSAEEMPEKLEWILSDQRAELRARLRNRALGTALRYRPALQRRKLAALAQTELAWLR